MKKIDNSDQLATSIDDVDRLVEHSSQGNRSLSKGSEGVECSGFRQAEAAWAAL